MGKEGQIKKSSGYSGQIFSLLKEFLWKTFEINEVSCFIEVAERCNEDFVQYCCKVGVSLLLSASSVTY